MATAELRFLEGASALRDRMRELSGRQPNANQVAFASSCLLHGRLFWESARAAPIETRPLLLYYGAAAFAKLLVIAKTGCQPSDIGSSHGASCAPGDGDTVGGYMIRCDGQGLFQSFNDVAARLCRLKYFENFDSRYISTPAAASNQLGGLELSLQEILARVPEVAAMYELCCRTPASITKLAVFAPIALGDDFTIRVDLPARFEGLDQLRAHVAIVRERVPFLSQWRLRSAQHAWDCSITVFCNRTGAMEPAEFEGSFDEGGRNFAATIQADVTTFEVAPVLPSLAGGYASIASYIAPVGGGVPISEHSLQLLGLLSLSSLVRYRPHVWTSCVHRRRLGDRPVDDGLLPAIEVFLDCVTECFPKLVADVLLAR